MNKTLTVEVSVKDLEIFQTVVTLAKMQSVLLEKLSLLAIQEVPVEYQNLASVYRKEVVVLREKLTQLVEPKESAE